MIRTFCDCCGKEIEEKFSSENEIIIPIKRVTISENAYWSNTFLIKLTIGARIYKPRNLVDTPDTENFVGKNLCLKCIMETLSAKDED